ncbi:hypothetical protein QBC38DRAFT_449135 [Podospora fimiseda]|uniref:Uncharacterized protein n=1 Tax=Podospora fimiseda TaxID=252190 RepID=A0AAN6YLT5_9PEZI|nr:hypothetical protein QBC38DRAFT_449135 [Podospora fimiseda]
MAVLQHMVPSGERCIPSLEFNDDSWVAAVALKGGSFFQRLAGITDKIMPPRQNNLAWHLCSALPENGQTLNWSTSRCSGQNTQTMDNAPLIKVEFKFILCCISRLTPTFPPNQAHDHARAASKATQTADTTVAVSEHAQAAGEFANAAKGTSSAEALRTLRLLEQHHRRLSELLRLPSEPTSQNSIDSDIQEEDEKDESPRPIQTPSVSSKVMPTLLHHRTSSRNLTSSIANNLASARGIPGIKSNKYSSSQPLAPSVSNDQVSGNLEIHPRRDGSTRSAKSADPAPKPSWVPPSIQEDDELPASPKPATTSGNDEGFSKFYSAFGGLINRLSAPLAFAGLPLIVEESISGEQTPASTPAAAPSPSSLEPSRRPSSRHQRGNPSIAEPDLRKIFSRATIRSLPPSADSYYFVPPSGHTASYASILNHEHKEKRRMAAGNGLDDEDEDDFVDAQEIIHQASVGASVPAGIRNRGQKNQVPLEKGLRNQVDELNLENASLKEALDKVSKRLHAFEMNSQSSHMALAQSIRFQRPGSPMSTSGMVHGGGGAAAEEAWRKKNKELEEQVKELTKRLVAMEKDYDKLKDTVEKYRDRWEKLKAGAKARRELQGQSKGEDEVR